VQLADGLAEISAPANGMMPEQPVVVSIRPERLRVDRAGSANGVENRMTGTLARRIFLGNVIREFVTLAPDLVIMAQRDVDTESLPDGAAVEVSWRAENTILLAET
jgi:ABC-type Fe3+/spermidine/putrescine transport system ATPase subunit